MPKVQYRETPFIKKILELYDQGRVGIQSSIHYGLASVQGWLATLNLTYKEGVIEGLRLPTQGGIAALAKALSDAEPQNQQLNKECRYYNFIYNTCYEYIADNQNRYFGRADLSDISHGKVIAMALLAHLCEQALRVPEHREQYYQRIQSFVHELLNDKDIVETRSNDTDYLSCGSALERISEANKSILQNEGSSIKDRINGFYNDVQHMLVSLENLNLRVNQFILPLLSSQEVNVESLTELAQQEHDAPIVASRERQLLGNPVINAVFIEPTRAYEEHYKKFYDGFPYQLANPSGDYSHNYLLDRLTAEGRENLISLLKLRDKLLVLTKEFLNVYKAAKNDEIALFHQFLSLANTYLIEIDKVNKQLHTAIEQFEIHCNQVYRQGQSNGGNDKNWKRVFFNKNPISAIAEAFITVSRKINETFSAIPIDYYQAFSDIQQETKNLSERSAALFGHQLATFENGLFDQAIYGAQNLELKRQDKLLLSKLTDIAAEYDDLIAKAMSKARESLNQDDKANLDTLIKLLSYRKQVIVQAIETMNQENAQNEDTEFDDWVLVSTNNEASTIFREDQAGNFLHIIRNYLTPTPAGLKSEEKEALHAELKKYKTTAEQLAIENQQLSQRNRELEEEVQQVQKREAQALEKIDKSTKQKENNVGAITRLDIFSDHNKLKLCAFASERCAPEATQHLFNVLNNVQTLIKQARAIASAYQIEAHKHDSSFLFSHNQRGCDNARKVMRKFEQEILQQVTSQLNLLMGSPEDVTSEHLKKLAQTLDRNIVTSISLALANETFSSHKQYSFRNYLRHLHAQLVNPNGTPAIKLLRTEPRELANLSGTVANEVAQGFARNELESYEVQNIQKNCSR
ncbi:Uncharacterised protein [Legionella beliardensis]|uniref:Uncharacterized protein n=1 Tax=Legionella beliardensis TaxID=91822 RepID=A0A378I0B1_9GAMM|nr:hypothetical protein [Legionella beliardensis]STX28412.1 Uncharacterised protein [Legionella beliardensis]